MKRAAIRKNEEAINYIHYDIDELEVLIGDNIKIVNMFLTQ